MIPVWEPPKCPGCPGSHPRAKWLRWMPGQKRKCLSFKQQVSSWIQFLHSGSRGYTSCVPTSYQPFSYRGPPQTERGSPAAPEPRPLQGMQSSAGCSRLGCSSLSKQISSYLDFLALLFASAHWTSPIAGHLPGGDYGNLMERHIGRAAGGQSLTGSLISSLVLKNPPAQFISWLCQAQF